MEPDVYNNPTPPGWRTELSLANVVMLATMIVALSVGWQSLASDVAASRTRIDKHDEQLKELTAERLRLTEILSELRADVRYLRQQVDAKPR